MQKAKKFEIELIKKEKVSKDAYSFYFKRPKNFSFLPGQYIKIFLEIENSDQRGTSRYFTISSSPTDKDIIMITTRVIQSSFKNELNSLNPGNKIKAFGPIGYFNYDPSLNSPAVFIAGGIGITPFHSLIRYLAAKKINSKITLFNSFSFIKETVFVNEFKDFEKENSNLKIIHSLTKEKSENYEFGKINAEMIKKYVPDFIDSHFFIVGPREMVDSILDQVISMGVTEEKIFKEDFTGY